jgi:hypothetical protein
MRRSNHRRFMKRGCRRLGAVALVTVIGSDSALAQNDSPSMPLRGPISFEAFDRDGSGGISEADRYFKRNRSGLPLASSSGRSASRFARRCADQIG